MMKEQEIKAVNEIADVLIDNKGKMLIEVAIALYNAGYRKQKHGTWYHGTENGAVYAKCSACGRKVNYSCYGYAYCSLCGARMDGAKMKGE